MVKSRWILREKKGGERGKKRRGNQLNFQGGDLLGGIGVETIIL